MENLLQLQQGSKSFGPKLLFDEATFSINEGEHVGVIGPNGAGKTTLFRVLVGEETLDAGQIIASRKLRLGYLSQHATWNPGETVEDFVVRGSVLPIWELKALGVSLGLTEDHYTRAIESLSGGYRMRAKLLQLLGQQPTLMLLDEPTNYLDLETLLVLEQFLQNYEGAFLLISHDREFLRRTTDHTLEVEGGEITKYNGHIDDYFEQKELLRSQLEARALSVQEKRKQILDFVSRFGAKATKAKQAQSRLKMMNKMEEIEVKPLPVSARIRIPPPSRVGSIVVALKDVKLGYGERIILQKVNLQLSRGQHLAVVGLNGAGKSTLLKAISGRLAPLSGTVQYGFEVTLAFFNQYVAEELKPHHTVYEALQDKAHSSLVPQEILDLAGSLLFSGDDLKKKISVLSGGERSRVALGQVLLQRASCLILDEPTNHLDFQTVEALTQSLQNYAGSVITVSHDRAFIRRVGTQILEVAHGQASVYPGTYDDYVWSLEKGAFATLHPSSSTPPPKPTAPASTSANPEPTSNAHYREKKKSLDRKLRQLNTQIEGLEVKIAKNQQTIHDLNARLLQAKTAYESQTLVKEMGDLQNALTQMESEWLTASEERDEATQELSALTTSSPNT